MVPRYEILNLDTVEPFSTDTSVLWTVSKKILIYFLKKNLYNNGLSLIQTTDTKSQPQGVNKLNLFIADAAVIRWIQNPNQVKSVTKTMTLEN